MAANRVAAVATISDMTLVDHFNTSLNGGAAMAALRLHQSLLRSGVASRFWYKRPREGATTGLPHVHSLDWTAGRSWPRRALDAWNSLGYRWSKYRTQRGRRSGQEFFSFPRTPAPTPAFPASQPRVVQLHWIAKFLDLPSFVASLPPEFPVVWTLHDMNPFTGGCHFSNGCGAFVSGCGRCPQLAQPSPRDLSRHAWAIKQAALRHLNLHVVAPSRWLLDQARQSPVFDQVRGFHHIPYGIDTAVYAPVERHVARLAWQIPADALVIGFGADSLSNTRKGTSELLAALRQLPPNPALRVVFFGNGSDVRLDDLTCQHAGFVTEPRRQAELYSAMDLFVLPSLADNLPQTGLEAMACGTPVVAFDTGGIPDYVVPDQTGLLAKCGDVADLAAKLRWLLARPAARRSFGEQARTLIESRFSWRCEAQSYLTLYEQMLGQSAQPAPPTRLRLRLAIANP